MVPVPWPLWFLTARAFLYEQMVYYAHFSPALENFFIPAPSLPAPLQRSPYKNISQVLLRS